MSEIGLSLRDGMDLSAESLTDVWFRYAAIGGNGTESEMADSVASGECGDHEHNLIAQAINESFIDRGEHHPVGYRGSR
jgi:hypothetical protein